MSLCERTCVICNKVRSLTMILGELLIFVLAGYGLCELINFFFIRFF